MDKASLYKLIDIDTPQDLAYFEQIADLLECEDEIDEDLFIDVLSMIEQETLAEILENYFDELTKSLPDAEDSLVLLVDSIHQAIKSKLDFDIDGNRNRLAVELAKFHEWYAVKRDAVLDGEKTSVLNAVAASRAGKFDDKAHLFDFAEALDYELDSISIPLGGFADMQEDSYAQ